MSMSRKGAAVVAAALLMSARLLQAEVVATSCSCLESTADGGCPCSEEDVELLELAAAHAGSSELFQMDAVRLPRDATRPKKAADRERLHYTGAQTVLSETFAEELADRIFSSTEPADTVAGDVAANQ
mmetsp:Transcript_92452/g.240877  ORF Transcript_92452/g.240877 Transcript_92452/m.240877 type:complete len:128 (-) Transcript_92452:98-481(-)